jgi:hypothetical protein
MIIRHETITDIKKVEEYYAKQFNCDVRYICTTELNTPDVPCDIFYRTKPINNDDRGYFGVYWDKGSKSLNTLNADMIEGMHFAMIEHDGEWFYSSTLSDEKTVGDKIIGGGRQHIAGWGFLVFALENGNFVRIDK